MPPTCLISHDPIPHSEGVTDCALHSNFPEHDDISLKHFESKVELQQAREVARETDDLIMFLQQREAARQQCKHCQIDPQPQDRSASLTGLNIRQRMFGKS